MSDNNTSIPTPKVAFMLPERNLAYRIELPKELAANMQLLHAMPGFQIHQLPNVALRIYPPVSEIVCHPASEVANIFVRFGKDEPFWCIYNRQPVDLVEETQKRLIRHRGALARYIEQLVVIDQMPDLCRMVAMRSTSKKNAKLVMEYGLSEVFFEF